jgi:hypothetical protein
LWLRPIRHAAPLVERPMPNRHLHDSTNRPGGPRLATSFAGSAAALMLTLAACGGSGDGN